MTKFIEKSGVPPLLKTIIEAAEDLRVGRSTVYELIRTKQLETVKIGRCTRVPAASITAFVAQLRSVSS